MGHRQDSEILTTYRYAWQDNMAGHNALQDVAPTLVTSMKIWLLDMRAWSYAEGVHVPANNDSHCVDGVKMLQ